MRTAAVVVVPSTYEGFGLPALEAMAAGAAVVAAARGALPEVCGDAALLVEPTGPELAAGIACALAGGADVERRRAAGRERALEFSWTRTAGGIASLYEELTA
jgi:glycosyltransferase involved in cell wall biosynthesis